jgi:hypothetical protein
MDPFTIGAVAAGVGSLAKLGMSLAGAGKRRDEQEDARKEMEEYRTKYEELDTSNLYANVGNQFENMENAFEDLTVNQQQAEFERNMAQQQQANMMQQMGGAAGASGIASLAQAMANQGLIQAQRAGASIGMQESQIGIRRAAEASRLQQMERRGEQFAESQRLRGADVARSLEYGKTTTLLGMSQERFAGANEAIRQAKAEQLGAVGNLAGVGMSMMQYGKTPGRRKKSGTTEDSINYDSYPDPMARGLAVQRPDSISAGDHIIPSGYDEFDQKYGGVTGDIAFNNEMHYSYLDLPNLNVTQQYADFYNTPLQKKKKKNK